VSLSPSVTAARAEDQREEWRLSALTASIYAIVGVQLPFFPLWLQSRELGADEIAAILSAPPLLRILTMLLASRRADRSGRHGEFLVGFALCAGLAYGLTSLAQGFAAILATVALVALAQGPINILADGIILGAAARRRALNRPLLHYSFVRGWGSVSILFFLLASGPVARALPNAALAWLLCGVSLAAAACAFIALRGVGVGVPAKARPLIGEIARPGLAALTIAAAALIQASHAMVFAFGALHWKASGHDETFVSLAWAAGLVTEVGFFLLANRWFGGESRAATHIALGGAAAALRWLLMAGDPGTVGIFAAQALHGLSCAAVQLGPAYLLARLVGAGRHAQAQAWLAASVAAGLSLATLVCGPLQTNFGERGYLAMAALAALGLALALGLGRALRRAEELRRAA
jgi:PPP family 3-phenylpropionic acid transporter